jgi:hypothetical protein
LSIIAKPRKSGKRRGKKGSLQNQERMWQKSTDKLVAVSIKCFFSSPKQKFPGLKRIAIFKQERKR